MHCIRALAARGGVGRFALSSAIAFALSYPAAFALPSPPLQSGAEALRDTVAPELSEVTVLVAGSTATLVWQTDEPTAARIDYGPGPELGGCLEREVWSTEHNVTLTGLEPGRTYHYRLTALDPANNTAETGGTFTASGGVPPVIYNIDVTVEETRATVVFRTNEAALGVVQYGPTPDLGSAVYDLEHFRYLHSFTLTGLEPGTLHYFKISAIDVVLNVSETPLDDFTTEGDGTPPTIANVVVAPSAYSTTISFTTDEPAISQVAFGPTSDYGDVMQDLSGYQQVHSFTLPGLLPNTDYHFRLTAADAGGNVGLTQDDTFRTVHDYTPPVISGLSVSVDDTTATIAWTTDEPAIARIDYGPTTSYGSHVQNLSSFRYNHSYTLTGLTPGTLYHFRLLCTNYSLLTLAQMDDTFATTGDVVPPLISGVEVATTGATTATVTWTTDEPATSRVDYGPTAAYGASVVSGNLTTSHGLELTGLLEGQPVHYRVTSTDADGNSAQTPDLSFTQPSVGVAVVTGTRIAWQPLTLSFEGPSASELDGNPNPFLYYRLVVDFTGPSGQFYRVHGFFDGDGNGGGTGDVWRVRFAPDAPGQWTYLAHFDLGPNIAVSQSMNAGTPAWFDGTTGTVDILARDPNADGFYKWGLLEYIGEHYLKFRDGPFYLKGGCDSPENFLAYRGFDNTFDQPGGTSTSGLQNGVHRYPSHVSDWQAGDPYFVSADTGYDSKGIIGALNYLSSKKVNSIYFLPMNLGGDGRDTYPFVGTSGSYFDKTHYDISKLRQWDVVFEHAQRKGIQLHIVLAETETENENYLDGGTLGTQRKLFYRELVARFGHHLAIKWNLAEESDYTPGTLESFAAYLKSADPYDHPIAFHTRIIRGGGGYVAYDAILGDPQFSMTSIQAAPNDMGDYMELWREESAAAGHKWVADADEQTDGLTDWNAADLRKRKLWDVYFSGGNLEWYFGYYDLPLGGDMRCEDFRTREEMWDYMGYARDFIEAYLPFWEMEPSDPLLTGEDGAFGGGEVFVKPNYAYAIYLPSSFSTGTLNLSGTSGTFWKSWYDPRTGQFVGGAQPVSGGGFVSIGAPPGGYSSNDWVVSFIKLP